MFDLILALAALVVTSAVIVAVVSEYDHKGK